jgi:hypothetical protein
VLVFLLIKVSSLRLCTRGSKPISSSRMYIVLVF